MPQGDPRDDQVAAITSYWQVWEGSPDGKLDAPMWARCIDSTSGTIYRKTTAQGTKTGWVVGIS